ncbi:hypothetical protein DFH09DRAFT_1415248 [Mycena vulgaris]|nr:hypothetical protein DFH09DRAFT_1415248 [Mycena vulgaris]
MESGRTIRTSAGAGSASGCVCAGEGAASSSISSALVRTCASAPEIPSVQSAKQRADRISSLSSTTLHHRLPCFWNLRLHGITSRFPVRHCPDNGDGDEAESIECDSETLSLGVTSFHRAFHTNTQDAPLSFRGTIDPTTHQNKLCTTTPDAVFLVPRLSAPRCAPPPRRTAPLSRACDDARPEHASRRNSAPSVIWRGRSGIVTLAMVTAGDLAVAAAAERDGERRGAGAQLQRRLKPRTPARAGGGRNPTGPCSEGVERLASDVIQDMGTALPRGPSSAARSVCTLREEEGEDEGAGIADGAGGGEAHVTGSVDWGRGGAVAKLARLGDTDEDTACVIPLPDASPPSRSSTLALALRLHPPAHPPSPSPSGSTLFHPPSPSPSGSTLFHVPRCPPPPLPSPVAPRRALPA